LLSHYKTEPVMTLNNSWNVNFFPRWKCLASFYFKNCPCISLQKLNYLTTGKSNNIDSNRLEETVKI
jgi:hypothetical protein